MNRLSPAARMGPLRSALPLPDDGSCSRSPTSSSIFILGVAASTFLPARISDLRSRIWNSDGRWSRDTGLEYRSGVSDTDVAGSGLLPVGAERLGKVVLTTEMGGHRNHLRASAPADAGRNCATCSCHLQVLRGELRQRADLGLPPTRWFRPLDREDYRFAPEIGIV